MGLSGVCHGANVTSWVLRENRQSQQLGGGRPVLRKERQEGEDQKLDVPVKGFFERNVTAAM